MARLICYNRLTWANIVTEEKQYLLRCSDERWKLVQIADNS